MTGAVEMENQNQNSNPSNTSAALQTNPKDRSSNSLPKRRRSRLTFELNDTRFPPMQQVQPSKHTSENQGDETQKTEPVVQVEAASAETTTQGTGASEKLWEVYDKQEEVVRTKGFGGRTQKLLTSAKRKHRTEISSREWGQYDYYKRWPKLKLQLQSSNLNNMKRIHGPDYTMQRFQQEIEMTSSPCVISGLADKWPARESWNLARMRQDFGERYFKCGEDDEGYPIKVKLKHFLRYQSSSEPDGAKLDDSPLYIFDSHFDEDRVGKQLLSEYAVPNIMSEDLFQLVGEKLRPPYRWILFGPSRSGSGVHIDPLGTSAWNTLVRGHKLWVLFPPTVKKSVVKGKALMKKGEDDEAIDWFTNLLPRILEKGGKELKDSMIQFIQKPGETVYVPTHWWHAVLNLDATIAVTQNFCSSGNFDAVWRETRKGRTRMAGSWLSALKESRSDLAKRAAELDEMDGFNLEEAIAVAVEKKRRKKELREQRRAERRRKRRENGEESQAESEDSTSSSSDD